MIRYRCPARHRPVNDGRLLCRTVGASRGCFLGALLQHHPTLARTAHIDGTATLVLGRDVARRAFAFVATAKFSDQPWQRFDAVGRRPKSVGAVSCLRKFFFIRRCLHGSGDSIGGGFCVCHCGLAPVVYEPTYLANTTMIGSHQCQSQRWRIDGQASDSPPLYYATPTRRIRSETRTRSRRHTGDLITIALVCLDSGNRNEVPR